MHLREPGAATHLVAVEQKFRGAGEGALGDREVLDLRTVQVDPVVADQVIGGDGRPDVRMLSIGHPKEVRELEASNLLRLHVPVAVQPSGTSDRLAVGKSGHEGLRESSHGDFSYVHGGWLRRNCLRGAFSRTVQEKTKVETFKNPARTFSSSAGIPIFYSSHIVSETLRMVFKIS